MKQIVSFAALMAMSLAMTDGWQPAARAAQAERPNILFILADDIGYADVSCYGATHARTPAIDGLASQGIRFSNAHSPASTCTPTRRALLTGTYSWRQTPGSSIAPGNAPLSIPVGTATVPSLLKQAGYHTGVVGKWHIGLGPEGGPDWNGEIKPGPLEIGFDYAFIMPATGDRVPTVYIENRRVVGLDPNDPIQVSYAKKIGNEPTGSEHPELTRLKAIQGHDNTIVNGVGRIGWMSGGKAARWKDEEMADTYTRKGIAFIEQHANGPFFLYFATHNIHAPRVPHPRYKGSSPSGTRGDSIQELDGSVSQLLATLDRLKLADKTLVIFTSDNGGITDDGYEDPRSFEYHPNAPLRGYKDSTWEGGHRVPFIARWPGKINPGSRSDALIAHTDMAATFAAIVGVNVPAGQCRDSFNVLPAMVGEKTDKPVRPHFVAHNGGTKGPFAILCGDWKYIEHIQSSRLPAAPGQTNSVPEKGLGKANEPRPPALFNLAKDISESEDLSAREPARMEELKALLAKIRSAGTSK